MTVDYDIHLEDLLRLDLALAERKTGMALWLRHLCGLVLGPVGVLCLAFFISECLHPTQNSSAGSEILTLLMSAFFLWLPFSAARYSAWNLRRQAKRRLQESPRLAGKRSLYLNANSVIEMTQGGLNGYLAAADKQAYLQEHVFRYWGWSELDSVREDKQDILLFAKSGEAIIVPFARQPPAEVQAFRQA